MDPRQAEVALSLAQARELFERQELLPLQDAVAIVDEAQRVMGAEPNIVPVSAANVYVIGDIHGQFFDLTRLLDDIGVGPRELKEEDMRLVFLGDYVDRGVFSCEVILYLLLLKARYPSKVVLLRGNHECESISSFYGFRNECRIKYGVSAYYHFLSCFQVMPLAALIDTPHGQIFCVHGGISPDAADLKAIDKIDRKREIPTTGPMCDLLWSDPAAEWQPSADDGRLAVIVTQEAWSSNMERGCSFHFNAAALFKFLDRNRLLAVVRAHEFEDDGFMLHFTGPGYQRLDTRKDRAMPPLLTVFSAPNYCDTYGNKGAYLVIRQDPFEWEIKQIETVGHPVPPIGVTERSDDTWRQFIQTLPFLPASKEFFDEIVRLAAEQHSDSPPQTSHEVTLADPRTASNAAIPQYESDQDSSAMLDAQVQQKRRLTSEMHPRAIHKELDDQVQKWMHSDEGHSCPPSPSASKHTAGQDDDVASALTTEHDRSKLLCQQELDMVKLVFSLIDTDGQMTLSAAKINRFVFNILGEQISHYQADTYLRALDFDGNGVVDFGDVLSWVATIKTRGATNDESVWGVSALRRLGARGFWWLHQSSNFRKACLWLTVACLIRDLYAFKQRRIATSTSLRVLGSLTTVMYGVDLLSKIHRPSWRWPSVVDLIATVVKDWRGML